MRLSVTRTFLVDLEYLMRKPFSIELGGTTSVPLIAVAQEDIDASVEGSSTYVAS